MKKFLLSILAVSAFFILQVSAQPPCSAGGPGIISETSPCPVGQTGIITVTYVCNTVDGTIINTNINNACVLPIELSNFEIKTEKGITKLVWNTASEVDNELFEVLRSYDGRNFDIIGEVNGAGTTFEGQSYEFVDRTAAKRATSSNVFYRLRQIDFDGQSTLTEAVSMKLQAGAELMVNNVVAENGVTVYFEAPANGLVTAHVADIAGKVVSRNTFAATEGFNMIELPMNVTGNGIFIMTVTDGVTVQTKKFFR